MQEYSHYACKHQTMRVAGACAGQVDDMRTAMEETLFQFGVDVIFAGHVHAYERSHPVFGGSCFQACLAHALW